MCDFRNLTSKNDENLINETIFIQHKKKYENLTTEILHMCMRRRIKKCLKELNPEKINCISKNIINCWEIITPIEDLPLPLPENLTITYNSYGSNRYEYLLNICYDDENDEPCEDELDFFCNTEEVLLDLLISDIKDETILYLTPSCIVNNLKLRYKYIIDYTIEDQHPDIGDDESPLYNTDDCPVCMETFDTANLCDPTPRNRKNTFCGHPICYECFDTIIRSNNKTCPICRSDYEDNDVICYENEKLVEEEYIEALQTSQNIDRLIKITNIEDLALECIQIDGMAHMLRMDFIIKDNDIGQYIFATYER